MTFIYQSGWKSPPRYKFPSTPFDWRHWNGIGVWRIYIAQQLIYLRNFFSPKVSRLERSREASKESQSIKHRLGVFPAAGAKTNHVEALLRTPSHTLFIPRCRRPQRCGICGVTTSDKKVFNNFSFDKQSLINLMTKILFLNNPSLAVLLDFFHITLPVGENNGNNENDEEEERKLLKSRWIWSLILVFFGCSHKSTLDGFIN